MRIAMVSEHASPLAALGGVDAGGQNVYVAALARAMAARGHQVDVYTRRDDPALPERVPMTPGVTVVHVPVGPPAPVPKDELLRWMPAFGRWLAADWARAGTARPEVVHAHFWMSGIAAVTAVRLVDETIPVVQTFHALGSVKKRFQGADDSSPAGRIATERMLAEEVDLVIATCTDEVAELDELLGRTQPAAPSPAPLPRGGPRPWRVRVVPCGVDLERFSPAGPAELPAGVPEETGPTMKHRLLCVARLVERKGVDTVVQALTRLPDAVLVVAGGPPAAGLDADPEAVRLRELARELGVEDRLRLVGSVGRDEMPALLRWADVVVATPWYEPFGMVPLEAMACGRPLVGSAVGGLLDTVLDGVTGVRVPPRDPAALAERLQVLLRNPVVRESMGRAARRRAAAGYGWDRVAAEVEAGYLSVLRATRTVSLSRLVPAEAM
jgi:D-inositol-3-phosphate glycosyltransferase